MFAFAGISSGAQGTDAGVRSGITEKKSGTEIDDRIPQINPGHSYLKGLSIDLLVPGGGHFYLGNYYSGALFAGLKIIGVLSLYYYYNDLEKKRDNYNSIRQDPSAGTDKIEGDKLEYERAHQHVAFAVIGTAAAYLSSLIFNYTDLKIFNEKSIPAFDYKYSLDRGSSGGDQEFFFVFKLRV